MNKPQKLFNLTKQTTTSNYVEVAKSFRQRSLGLLGRKTLESKNCLWILKCNSVHTFFMKFSIDVLYVDKNLNVTKIQRDLKPWSLSWGGFKSRSCFEFKSNDLDTNIELGDSLRVSP